MKKTDRIVDRLDPDDLWDNPEKGWVAWGEEIGAHPVSVSAAMRKAGWVRDGGTGALREAPCRLCYESYEVDVLSDDRLCPSCRYASPYRDLYESELKKYISRHPHMAAGVERSLE